MAKKQTFTVGSKDNMRSRLQELKDYTFNPLTGVNPSEEQYEFEKFVQQVDKSRVAIQNDLEQAQMLFDSLMQEYFGQNRGY